LKVTFGIAITMWKDLQGYPVYGLFYIFIASPKATPKSCTILSDISILTFEIF
jgi:hypothetical protein